MFTCSFLRSISNEFFGQLRVRECKANKESRFHRFSLVPRCHFPPNKSPHFSRSRVTHTEAGFINYISPTQPQNARAARVFRSRAQNVPLKQFSRPINPRCTVEEDRARFIAGVQRSQRRLGQRGRLCAKLSAR